MKLLSLLSISSAWFIGDKFHGFELLLKAAFQLREAEELRLT